jgi:hypothetical protein
MGTFLPELTARWLHSGGGERDAAMQRRLGAAGRRAGVARGGELADLGGGEWRGTST